MTTLRADIMSDTPIRTVNRIIGRYGEADSGPLVIAVAGLHGNEHAGVEAAARVIASLETRKPVMHGRMLAVAGNLPALERNERFIDRDLNRMWSSGNVSRVRNSEPSADEGVEDTQLRELLRLFDEVLDEHRGPVIFLDLHSTSADAVPFCIMSDTLQNRGVAFSLGIPVILGLEEAITGTIQEFFGERGFVTLAVEGGQHTAPLTTERIESALWVVLRAAGLLASASIPDLALHRSRLRDVSDGLPGVVEVFFRHGLEPGDQFRMREGFRNFSPVHRGELVAQDRSGGIQAPEDGLLILPSYQGIGDDGFFMGRQVRHFWLSLSAVVRRLRVDRLLHIMPGVQKDPGDPRILYVDLRVARWLTLKVFHLAGYRKCSSDNGLMLFKQRVEG